MYLYIIFYIYIYAIIMNITFCKFTVYLALGILLQLFEV